MRWGVKAALAALFLPASAFAATITAPSCVISTPPGTHHPGDAARLIWYTENASHASLNNGLGEMPLQGFLDVYPSQSTTYVMNVSSEIGMRTCAVQIAITPRPNPSVLYQPTALPVTLFPNQVYWAPMQAPYATTYYDDGYDWYVDSPYMPSDTYYIYDGGGIPQQTVSDGWYAPASAAPQNQNLLWVPDTPESVASPDSPLFDPPFGPPKPGIPSLFANSTEVDSPLMGAVNSFPTALQPETYYGGDPAPSFSPPLETSPYYPENNTYEPQLTQTSYYYVPDGSYSE